MMFAGSRAQRDQEFWKTCRNGLLSCVSLKERQLEWNFHQAVELLGVRTRQSLSTLVTNQVVQKIRTPQHVNDLNPCIGVKPQKE